MLRAECGLSRSFPTIGNHEPVCNVQGDVEDNVEE